MFKRLWLLLLAILVLFCGCSADNISEISDSVSDLLDNSDVAISSEIFSGAENSLKEMQEFVNSMNIWSKLNEIYTVVREGGETAVADIQSRVDKYKAGNFEDTLTYDYLLTTFDVQNWSMICGIKVDSSVCVARIKTADNVTSFISIDGTNVKRGYIENGATYRKPLNSEGVKMTEADGLGVWSVDELYQLMTKTHKWEYVSTVDLSSTSDNETKGYQIDMFTYENTDISFIWNASNKEFVAIYVKDNDLNRTCIYKPF